MGLKDLKAGPRQALAGSSHLRQCYAGEHPHVLALMILCLAARVLSTVWQSLCLVGICLTDV